MNVQVSVLGPLRLSVDGRFATPTARKPRQLLALLLLEANRSVSVSRLVRGLWDDAPPRSAQVTLQTYVLQLRKLLAGCLDADRTSAKEIVVTTDVGYAFALGDGTFDLLEFRRLTRLGSAALGDGDVQSAAESLRGALSFWSGRALADVHPSRFLEAETRRLDDSWMRAQEQCMDADLRLGRHEEILDQLSELCVRHRCNEKFSLGYVVALYRCGLRIEALKVFREFRQNLVATLGLEPASALCRLNEAILRADHRLDDVCAGTPFGVARDLLAGQLSSHVGSEG